MKTASRTKFFIEFYSTCLEGECLEMGWGGGGSIGAGVGGVGGLRIGLHRAVPWCRVQEEL